MTVKVFLLDFKIATKKNNRSKLLKYGRNVLLGFNNLPCNCYLIEFPSCKIKRIQLNEETEWNKANQYGSGFSCRQFLFTACWFGKVCDKDLIQGDFEAKGNDTVFDLTGAMAYSKAILLDTEEDEYSDSFSTSLRGKSYPQTLYPFRFRICLQFSLLLHRADQKTNGLPLCP